MIIKSQNNISKAEVVDPLKGLRVGIIGSSSAVASGYFQYVEQKTGIIQVNNAVAGSTLTSLTEDYKLDTFTNNTASIVKNHLIKLDELPVDLDMLIIQPGVNDQNFTRPLGVWADTTPTTMYGALHMMCKKIYDKYPLIPKGVLTTQYYSQALRDRTSEYKNVVKEVCNYYSLPTCDLHDEGNTPYSYQAWQTKYASDGLHVNEEGQLALSRRVTSFLRSLNGK